LNQLTPMQNPRAFDSTGSCAAASSDSLGWCYVTGAAAMGCAQAILLTGDEPPPGATLSLKCM
jgi:hypothetical protein